jgi:hypothetical protein
VLHECRRDRPASLLGRDERGTPTSGAAGLVDQTYRSNAQTHLWVQCIRRTRMPVEDSYIAATAKRHQLTIVTGNDQDFLRPGLEVFNPFKELPNR